MIEYHDSHCHLTQFMKISNIINNAIKNNVNKIIAVSMFLEDNIKVLELSEKYPRNIMPALGIHPSTISYDTDVRGQFEKIEKLLEENISKIKIIGEIGLDKYFIKDKIIFKKQKEAFKLYLELAEKNKLGITVHGKYAELEIMEILEQYKISPTIIYWYSTPDIKLIKRGIDNKFYYSVNFSIFYSKKVIKLVELTPIEQLLTESDGPVFYKPVNLKGKPEYIPKIVKEIAKIKKIKEDEVGIILNENFKKIFNLK